MNKNQNYTQFLYDVKDRIHKAGLRAYQSVNQELIRLYWEIGRAILQNQEKEGWGSGQGFSVKSNLTNGEHYICSIPIPGLKFLKD